MQYGNSNRHALLPGVLCCDVLKQEADELVANMNMFRVCDFLQMSSVPPHSLFNHFGRILSLQIERTTIPEFPLRT